MRLCVGSLFVPNEERFPDSTTWRCRVRLCRPSSSFCIMDALFPNLYMYPASIICLSCFFCILKCPYFPTFISSHICPPLIVCISNLHLLLCKRKGSVGGLGRRSRSGTENGQSVGFGSIYKCIFLLFLCVLPGEQGGWIGQGARSGGGHGFLGRCRRFVYYICVPPPSRFFNLFVSLLVYPPLCIYPPLLMYLPSLISRRGNFGWSYI